MPTIYPRSSRKMVGTLRFAHPTGLPADLLTAQAQIPYRAATNQHDGKSLLISRNSVNPSPQKYSASVSTQITGITPPVPPDERALANVTNARWDAVDADGVTDVRACGVR
jgi:hypothetical protein